MANSELRLRPGSLLQRAKFLPSMLAHGKVCSTRELYPLAKFVTSKPSVYPSSLQLTLAKVAKLLCDRHRTASSESCLVTV